MTMQFPVPDQHRVNEPLFASPADWISPGFDEPIDPNADFSGGPPQGRWFKDPPEADGRKVFQPDDGGFTVELRPGTYAAEWFSLADRNWIASDAVSAKEGGPTQFVPPSANGASVLHLRQGA
jgi:hypothetical protein